jgi:hypothetical protein
MISIGRLTAIDVGVLRDLLDQLAYNFDVQEVSRRDRGGERTG